MTYLDAVSLAEHHRQALLFHAEFDVEGVTESLLSLDDGEVVVVIEDHASGLGDDEDAVNAHFSLCQKQFFLLFSLLKFGLHIQNFSTYVK